MYYIIKAQLTEILGKCLMEYWNTIIKRNIAINYCYRYKNVQSKIVKIIYSRSDVRDKTRVVKFWNFGVLYIVEFWNLLFVYVFWVSKGVPCMFCVSIINRVYRVFRIYYYFFQNVLNFIKILIYLCKCLVYGRNIASIISPA